MPGPEAIMEQGRAYWASRALLTAVELGVFTELGPGPLELEELRSRLGLAGRGTRDFLDALVALGLLERADGRYSNTPDTARYLDRNAPGYIGGILEMAALRIYRHWGSLTEALRTGDPQNEISEGGDFFAETYADERRLRLFLRAMTGLTLPVAPLIAQRFPGPGQRTFVDVGCAEGALPAQVALAHPDVAVAGFDLPQVEPAFHEYVAARGLAGRVAFHAGDFLHDPLPPADVLSMGHILHDWDLGTKLMLLDKAYAALPEGGILIVYETLIDDERRHNAFGLLMSLNMLIETPGGFDFTGADCQGWMRSVGFRHTRVEPLTGPDSMVIGVK